MDRTFGLMSGRIEHDTRGHHGAQLLEDAHCVKPILKDLHQPYRKRQDVSSEVCRNWIVQEGSFDEIKRDVQITREMIKRVLQIWLKLVRTEEHAHLALTPP